MRPSDVSKDGGEAEGRPKKGSWRKAESGAALAASFKGVVSQEILHASILQRILRNPLLSEYCKMIYILVNKLFCSRNVRHTRYIGHIYYHCVWSN